MDAARAHANLNADTSKEENIEVRSAADFDFCLRRLLPLLLLLRAEALTRPGRCLCVELDGVLLVESCGVGGGGKAHKVERRRRMRRMRRRMRRSVYDGCTLVSWGKGVRVGRGRRLPLSGSVLIDAIFLRFLHSGSLKYFHSNGVFPFDCCYARARLRR
jgi:hypothetical protein